ncbi:MAG: mdh [Chlamydiales bacterium]|jgi:malate dehydrogenase|nr:mdh [Chlamydiales bacterium]
MKRVAITGAAGQIAYSLIFRLAKGEVFGPDEKISLHLLEVEAALPALEGVRLELEDCAFPLLEEVQIGHDPYELFKAVDLAVLIGSKPRSIGMERSDLLRENGRIFQEQGQALDKVAARHVKVLVVGNPCNTNCWIAKKHAPSLPKENFHAMTRLDENRAKALLAQKARVSVGEVGHVAIWGNHSATQVPDYFHARIQGKSALEIIDEEWLKGHFMSAVQNRGAEVIAKRGKSSAASAASAILDALYSIYHDTQEGGWFSSAILSDDNPYGIAPDLVFSFPCRLIKGRLEIIPGLDIAPLKRQIEQTEQELLAEREVVRSLKIVL